MIHNRIEFLTIITPLLSRRESYCGAYKRKIRELLCLETFSLEKKQSLRGLFSILGRAIEMPRRSPLERTWRFEYSAELIY